MIKQALTTVLLLTCTCLFGQASAIAPAENLTVQLQGANSEQNENIRAILQLDSKGRLSNHFRKRLQVDLAAQSMTGSIAEALEPFGYFNPTIRHSITKSEDGWHLSYQIEPGKPVHYRKINLTISGGTLPAAANKKLEEHWPIEVGMQFTQASYNQAKNLLTTIAEDYGFFKYQILSSHVNIDRRARVADVNIHFFLGKRYRFGETTFNKSPLSQRFLHRFLTYQVDEPYLKSKFESMRSGLINSHYFSSVNLSSHPDDHSGRTDIQASLRQLPPRTYTLGGGYGTDTGVRGLLTATFNGFNPEGHRFNVLMRGSAVNSAFVATYTIPGSYPPTDHYNIIAEINQLDQIPGKSDSRKLAGSYSTKIGHWSLTAELNALKEDYDFSNLPRTKTDLLYPEITLQYLQADNILFPNDGFSFTFIASGAQEGLLSKVSFRQYNTHVRFIKTIFEKIRVLVRSNFAYTDIKRIEQLPLSLQLMAGGLNSIRGFSYNSIYDGRELFTASAELQYKTYGNWYLAAFYDIGNVSNDVFDGDMHRSAGPAIIWSSPLGSLEISCARTLSTVKKSWKLQVSMGTFL